jgi:hypothetical protein
MVASVTDSITCPLTEAVIVALSITIKMVHWSCLF